MIALLDTSQDLHQCETEIGCEVQQLLTPLTRFRLQRPSAPFAIDNGAFAGFNRAAFESLLEREYSRRKQCLFVALPDVVADARRTLELFEYFAPRCMRWPVALVAQDGQENLPIPWKHLQAVFIGGSTNWKMSHHAVAIIRCAKAMGIWVHAGRVNTPGRFEYFENLGADSIDGTGISRYSWMRERIYKSQSQPNLFNQKHAA